MTAQITTRITADLNRKLVLDTIGTIIAEEAANQEALAVAAAADSEPYRLRVFTARLNPIVEWLSNPDLTGDDVRPVVSVNFNRHDFDRKKSEPVKDRQGIATYWIDCFGYGKAADTLEGHTPADLMADEQANWASTLVEQFLTAGIHTYLRQRGVVATRFLSSVERFVPEIDRHPVSHVVCYRSTLDVEIGEASPQVEGVPLTRIDVRVNRNAQGELLVEAAFPLT